MSKFKLKDGDPSLWAQRDVLSALIRPVWAWVEELDLIVVLYTVDIMILAGSGILVLGSLSPKPPCPHLVVLLTWAGPRSWRRWESSPGEQYRLAQCRSQFSLCWAASGLSSLSAWLDSPPTSDWSECSGPLGLSDHHEWPAGYWSRLPAVDCHCKN